MKTENVKPAGIRKLLSAADLTVVAERKQISKNNGHNGNVCSADTN